MSTLTVPTVTCVVTRDPMTIIHTTICPHEVDIVRAIFGADNVELLEGETGTTEIDAEGEIKRLENKYGTGQLEAAFGQTYAGTIRSLLLTAKAKTSAPAAGGDLNAMTKDQLIALGKDKGLQVNAAMNKAELIAAITAAE